MLHSCSLFSSAEWTEEREHRRHGGGKRRKKKKKKKKKAAIFVIAFFFMSAERKVVGKVLRNLNRPDSQGVVVLIFSNREKTPLL